MVKEIELGILIILGVLLTAYYAVCIFNTTYMEVIKSQCTGIKHEGRKIIVFFGLIEALFILGGLLFTEWYARCFIFLLVWSILWSCVSSCKLGSDKRMYQFHVVVSLFINLFITLILFLWLNKIIK